MHCTKLILIIGEQLVFIKDTVIHSLETAPVYILVSLDQHSSAKDEQILQCHTPSSSMLWFRNGSQTQPSLIICWNESKF